MGGVHAGLELGMDLPTFSQLPKARILRISIPMGLPWGHHDYGLALPSGMGMIPTSPSTMAIIPTSIIPPWPSFQYPCLKHLFHCVHHANIHHSNIHCSTMAIIPKSIIPPQPALHHGHHSNTHGSNIIPFTVSIMPT
ncbi:hypothetical protein TURU_036225 [Turdus rufiventris]|nr:hypothetical protein TURU_036225 [Turdus rufiventris]